MKPEFVLKQYGPVRSYVRTDRWCRLCGVLGLTPLSCWDWGYLHVGRDEGDLPEFSHSLQHEVNIPAAEQNCRTEESRTRLSRGVYRSQEEEMRLKSHRIEQSKREWSQIELKRGEV
jgi:hypothetical protein